MGKMENKIDHGLVGADSENAEPRQRSQDQEQAQRLARQQEHNKEFQRLIDDLFNSYDVDTALEEAAVIGIAQALWRKRDHHEPNCETRKLDQEISRLLGHLLKSKALREGRGSCSKVARIGILSYRKTSQLELIKRTRPQRSRATPQLLPPSTDEQCLENGLSPEATEARRRERYNELYCKMIHCNEIDAKLSPDEEIEFEALGARDPVWKPARIEDHPLYDSIQAWRNVAEAHRQEAPRRRRDAGD
jgi:hypothetical protein